MGYGIAPTSCLSFPREKEAMIMDWEAPAFVEVKMDSEINSYQDDFKDLPEAQEQPQQAVASTASNRDCVGST